MPGFSKSNDVLTRAGFTSEHFIELNIRKNAEINEIFLIVQVGMESNFVDIFV